MTATAIVSNEITHAFRHSKKDNKTHGDTVVQLCKQIAALEKEDKKISRELSKIAKRYGNSDEFYEPSIVCYFPAFPEMDKHGLIPEPPRTVDSINKAKLAGASARAIASYYGSTEQQQAINLATQWEMEISVLLKKIDAFKVKSGYAALDEQSNKLYDEACELRNRMYTIPAKSAEGLLQQIADMKNWSPNYKWADMVKWFDVIAEGVRNISK